MDTGLDINHEDLVAQVWVNQGELKDPGTGQYLADFPVLKDDGYVDGVEIVNWLSKYNKNGKTGDFNKDGKIDLRDAIHPGSADNPNPLIDGKDGLDGKFGGGNGYVDDILGWDFVDNYNLKIFDHGVYKTASPIRGEDYKDEDNDITPDIGRHGTEVGGLMAAEGDNGAGIAGVAFKSKLMLLRTAVAHSIWPDGDDELDDVARAVTYAHSTANGPRVIAMPFTEELGVYIDQNNPKHLEELQFLKESIENAYNDQAGGILFVASAGNAGRRSDGTIFPADWPTVMSVGGTDRSDRRYGNYGPHVDLAAPAVDILTTDPTGTGYVGGISGTSFSAPLVAGAAGLLFAQDPALNQYQVREILKTNTDHWGEGGLPNIAEFGTGRLNVYKALSAFQRGDSNADGKTDLADAIFLLHHLFLGGEKPRCLDAADFDNTGVLDLSDVIYLLRNLFLGGPAIPEPFRKCGTDTGTSLGCNNYPLNMCPVTQ